MRIEGWIRTAWSSGGKVSLFDFGRLDTGVHNVTAR